MDLGDALAELVAHSGDRLLRVAYQLTHDPAAAQDLVQDALLRVYRSMRRRGLPPQDWYAYLRRAVINEYLRSRRLRSSSEVVTDRMPERQSVSSPEDQIADRSQLWTALAALSARQRAALFHPAPRGGTCTPHDPASNNTSETINGYRVVVKRMTIGGVPEQQLCAAQADGFWLSIIESGPHPPIDVATLFKLHMRLLGTDPATWTSHPLT